MDNDKLKNLIKSALSNGKPVIKESRIKYKDSTKERMHKQLEEELRDNKTSLGKHPAFPDDDESNFGEKLMGGRFEEVCNRVKRHFDMTNVDEDYLKNTMMGSVNDCYKMEAPHLKELESLAVKMVIEEFDIPEGSINFDVKLTTEISLEGTRRNPTPISIDDMDFESHKNIEEANGEVYKRRFANAMIQGAAKKSHHMFNLKEEELNKINPQLMAKYGKVMSAADYLYFTEPNLDKAVSGGVVKVIFPKFEGDIPTIQARAFIFPVLIHELVKGVMELMSANGLPKDAKMRKYAIGKADFLEAEPWDMRIGPAIWQKFLESINPEDFHLKHHLYSELISLPVNEFNSTMKEIMAGTKEGKKRVANILNEIKNDLKMEEFESSMNERRNSYKDTFESPDELDDLDLSDFGL